MSLTFLPPIERQNIAPDKGCACQRLAIFKGLKQGFGKAESAAAC
jgi:hypothetical protein